MATPARLLSLPNSEAQRRDALTENDVIDKRWPVSTTVTDASDNKRNVHKRSSAEPSFQYESAESKKPEGNLRTVVETSARVKPKLRVDTSVANVNGETRPPVLMAENERGFRPTRKPEGRAAPHVRSIFEAITALEKLAYTRDDSDSGMESDSGRTEVNAIHNAHLSKCLHNILRVRSHNDVWAAENILLHHRRTPYVMRSVATSFSPGEDKDIFMFLADRVEDDMLEFAFAQNKQWQKLYNSRIAEAEERIRAEITERAQGQLNEMQGQFIRDTKAKNRVALDAITAKNWEAIFNKMNEDPDHQHIEAEKATALADKRWSQLMMHYIGKQTEFLDILQKDLRGLDLAKDMWELIEQSKQYTEQHVQMCTQKHAEAIETLAKEVELDRI